MKEKIKSSCRGSKNVEPLLFTVMVNADEKDSSNGNHLRLFFLLLAFIYLVCLMVDCTAPTLQMSFISGIDGVIPPDR